MKFVISGYFGFQNIGDEAVLAAMIEHLKEEAPGSEIVVLSKDPALTNKLHNVSTVNRGDILRISRELRSADLFISGGGSLLQDVTSFRSALYYLALVALAKMMKKPVFFYAQGIGPLTRKATKALVRIVANRVDTITVRDEQSRALLQSIGVTKPKIHVAADPVFGLSRREGKGRGRKLLEACGISVGDRPLVIVSMRPWLGVPGYIQAVASACDDLAKARDAVIVYVPFHSTQDVPICQACIELMQMPAYMWDCPDSPKDVISVIEDADFVIGMRYHALVFAVAAGTPFVALSYDPKVDGLLSIVGEEPGLSAVERSTESFRAHVKDAWSRREEMQGKLLALVPKLGESAKQVASLAVNTVSRQARPG
ncbi:MAG: polysaccharide pyruvyl transferase CsaB [Bacillota bacterium]|jgi:polysaccharide pyruvyl transferase CsaB|nr:polysaccharide pyruvyl transferase CsaB [Bacillota bacterium]NLD11954.1 polysaccharide pyruvyl transferase CsaB [Bacillota bacterium]HOB87944.1 polysaccharide pyruvyl transferase CsaB [Bacillota bacterium]HOJ56953.1 polysaccharide pyruvyl transferase CsaB [Bacillota bacterium]HOL01721.1 polysaccharide pyruvyl transferase CsaB [Bacillota bacterium]